jgi:aryl-alcohol dehydrogenase-like predicted oxidoreductase
MKLVKLQNEKIPPIALGTWSWGTGEAGGDAVLWNYLTAEDLKPVFDAAMSAGFNLWDTARCVWDERFREHFGKLH